MIGGDSVSIRLEYFRDPDDFWRNAVRGKLSGAVILAGRPGPRRAEEHVRHRFQRTGLAVHGPLRLGVLTALQTQGARDYPPEDAHATDGAGNAFAKAGRDWLHQVPRRSSVAKPKSTYTITASGHRALLKYVDTLQAIVNLVQQAPTNPGYMMPWSCS